MLFEGVRPALRRPHADMLNGSRFANMKELRFDADVGVWRLSYALDPDRKAMLLVAGDKSGYRANGFTSRSSPRLMHGLRLI